jgi:hypothetical protein
MQVDPFPFTREGRLFERIEHELALSQAVLRVGALVLEKQALRAKRAQRRDFRMEELGEAAPFRGLYMANNEEARAVALDLFGQGL